MKVAKSAKRAMQERAQRDSMLERPQWAQQAVQIAFYTVCGLVVLAVVIAFWWLIGMLKVLRDMA